MYDKCYSNQTLNMKSCFLDRLESPRPLWRPAGNGQRLETVWWRHWVAQVKTRRQQLPEKWPIPVEFPESKIINMLQRATRISQYICLNISWRLYRSPISGWRIWSYYRISVNFRDDQIFDKKILYRKNDWR